MNSKRFFLALLAASTLAAALPTLADGRGGEHAAQHFDSRHQHNQYYPARGIAVPQPPRGAIAVNHFGGGRYWYHGGVWYAPHGPRWIVVGPPFGIFVPVLPPFYTTVWFGGLPYYYANDAYYVWRDSERGYEVVEPPAGVAPATETPVSEDVFMYPRQGQSPDQQARDRYECHRWAADQTGFDPTRPAGGVPTGEAVTKRSDYQRAISACLEGRGYSVK